MAELDETQAAETGPVICPAGRRRRFFAFALDVLILGAVCLLIGYSFYDWAIRIGPAGKLVGLALALPYFSYFDSRLGGGRSPGKRLLKIAVVGPDGSPLSVPAALLRSLILLVPFLSNGLQLGDAPKAVMVLVSFLVFGLLVSSSYLFLFNRRTRQLLHDLAVNSMLIPAGQPLPARLPIWRGHWAVVGGLCVLSLLAPLLLPAVMPAQMSQILAVRQSVLAMPDMKDAGVTLGMVKVSSEPVKDCLTVTAVLRRKPESMEAAARQVAEVVLNQHRDFLGARFLVVNVVVGFDLGFGQGQQNFRFPTSAAAWPNRATGAFPG